MSDAKRSIELAKRIFKPNPLDLMVEAIECDICDRSGLKREWAKIDDDIKKEIKDTWKEIITECLDLKAI